MAIRLSYKLFGHQPRPWGYEVRADIWDEDDNHYSICMIWKKEPQASKIIKEVERRIKKLEKKLLEPPEEIEENYLQSEVTEILTNKGILTVGQKFPDDLVMVKIDG